MCGGAPQDVMGLRIDEKVGNHCSRIMIIARKSKAILYNPFFGGFLRLTSLHFSQDISMSVTCFITASVSHREEVCNTSFQWCGKYVAVVSKIRKSSDLN